MVCDTNKLLIFIDSNTSIFKIAFIIVLILFFISIFIIFWLVKEKYLKQKGDNYQHLNTSELIELNKDN
jgi:hypothetical protein